MTLPGWVGVREPGGRLGGRYTKNVTICTICPTLACTTPCTVPPCTLTPYADVSRRIALEALRRVCGERLTLRADGTRELERSALHSTIVDANAAKALRTTGRIYTVDMCYSTARGSAVLRRLALPRVCVETTYTLRIAPRPPAAHSQRQSSILEHYRTYSHHTRLKRSGRQRTRSAGSSALVRHSRNTDADHGRGWRLRRRPRRRGRAQRQHLDRPRRR